MNTNPTGPEVRESGILEVDQRTSGFPDFRPRTQRAFTLIEALIAIVLVATVLPVALAAISHVTQSVSRMRQQAIAVRLADERLAQWLVDGSWQTAAASSDFTAATDGEDSERFHWQLSRSAWRDATVTVLHLSVGWEPLSAINTVSVDTLVTPPETTTGAATTTPATTSGSP